jgi:hypothetical protein
LSRALKRNGRGIRKCHLAVVREAHNLTAPRDSDRTRDGAKVVERLPSKHLPEILVHALDGFERTTRGHPFRRRERRCRIPAKALLVRYPNGDFEYDFTRRDFPVIGEKVRRKGELWRVTRIAGSPVPIAYVEPAEGTRDLPPSAPR